MFTGLVRYQGKISALTLNEDGMRATVSIPALEKAEIGASICCSGCCLTLIEQNGQEFVFEISNETLSKTTLGNWKIDKSVNIEPSLKLGDELGGHFVFGHVDGIASLQDVKQDGDSYRLTICPPPELMKFIAPKGSIALDGISLTVNEVDSDTFGVNIIPHTWDHTTLKYKVAGDNLNIEVDMLARYVQRMIGHGA